MQGDITSLIQKAQAKEPGASDALFRHIYDALRQLARAKLAVESTLSQLDATSLVHETYLRLTRGAPLPQANRYVFFAYAASTMRSVIVGYVRERKAIKRGSGVPCVTLITGFDGADSKQPEIEALEDALQKLDGIDNRCCRIVEMRYFAGMSIDEIAEVLALSPATVKRDWTKARAFLFKALQE